ncbi:hypothetical protein C1H46_041645 [Malus baccata]|uniref:Uncharacterized protein n=1 Tax=Malus baccata TaxID=106549 RepID=A0A540KF97_MALBA|nr:hypothetical protein C1H46_041645 [Malus baccata]
MAYRLRPSEEHNSEWANTSLNKSENANENKIADLCVGSPDALDRQLVIQYVRDRATLGAKFHQVDWASLTDIPAPPRTCQKRMTLLKSNRRFRIAFVRLCNMISERYAKFLGKTQNRSSTYDDCRLLLPGSAGEDHNSNFPSNSNQVTGIEEEPWYDFDDNNIKKALEEVLHYKRMSKLDASKRVGSTCEDWSDRNTNSEESVIIQSLHLGCYSLSLSPHARTYVSIKSHLPEVLRSVYSAIQKAGDGGLGIGDVSRRENNPGERMTEFIIDVNAYDSVRFVDLLYRDKYFMTSMPGDINMNVDDVHKLTFLNLTEMVFKLSDEKLTICVPEVCTEGKEFSPRGDGVDETSRSSSGELCVPILPWINGDGTINKIIYKGLRRRVLGAVMQNPGMVESSLSLNAGYSSKVPLGAFTVRYIFTVKIEA